MITANSSKNAQIIVKQQKTQFCHNLPPHTNDEENFNDPQVLKLASGTHTEWISK